MGTQSAGDEEARGAEHSLVEGLSNAASQTEGHLSRDEIDDLLGVRTLSLADGSPRGRDDASLADPQGSEGVDEDATDSGQPAPEGDEVAGPDGAVTSEV